MSNLNKQIYMDYGATHPLSSATKQYITSLLDVYGNPSSQYTLGDESRKILNDARQEVARFINSKVDNIYFTSSGCASNTLGIKGFLNKHDNAQIFYSPIAHKSILKQIPTNSTPIIVSRTGRYFISDLENVLKNSQADYKLLVIDYANSEIGTIQDVKDIITLAHQYNTIVYMDCTGSITTIPIDVIKLDIDMLGFSGHKLGALKGVGVFYKKESIELEPIIYGSQEDGLIAGTENIIGIGSLYSAIKEFDYYDEETVINKRNLMWDLLKDTEDCYLVGEDINSDNRLINNLYICFKGISGEALVTLLSNEGIYISTGSACNSGIPTPSNTLTSINMFEEDLFSCIRITLNKDISDSDILYASQYIKQYVNILRKNDE